MLVSCTPAPACSTHSACACSGEDHPGPDVSVGRGAPEIDIFEAEHNKTGGTNGIISMSSQYAPFDADYLYQSDTADKWIVYNETLTQANTYQCVLSRFVCGGGVLIYVV